MGEEISGIGHASNGSFEDKTQIAAAARAKKPNESMRQP
jgi:hypothetical protein